MQVGECNRTLNQSHLMGQAKEGDVGRNIGGALRFRLHRHRVIDGAAPFHRHRANKALAFV